MTVPLSDEQHAAIRAREQAATAGPWGWYDGGDYADVVADYQSTGRGSYSCRQHVARIEADWSFDDAAHEDWDENQASEQACADADYIAHAREDVPALLAEVDRLRQHVEELQVKLLSFDDNGKCCCSFEGPGDVCLVHSPTVVRLRAELATARAQVLTDGARLIVSTSRARLDAIGDDGRRPSDWERHQEWLDAADLLLAAAADGPHPT